MRTALTLLLFVLWLPATKAEDLVAKVDLPLKMPRSREGVLGAPRDSVQFMVWIPDGVKTVRGGVCNPFSKMEVPSGHWQAACRLWGFAYVAADFDAVKKEEFGLLETALNKLSEQTGHAELDSLKLCFLGMSRGGGMSVQFSELMPLRTIAAAPYSEFTGNKSRAVWLPSARSTAVWQAFVGHSPLVKIKYPAGLGDGQKFGLHAASESVMVEAAVDGTQPSLVELWDAEAKLAVLDRSPWKFEAKLKPGIHSLIVKAIAADEVRSSRPHTIIVAEGGKTPSE